MTNWYDKPLTSKQKDAVIEELRQDNTSLLHLLAQVREACGDNGKRMQDELVEYIRDEWQGHISHIALLKGSLKAERARVRELTIALEHCIPWMLDDCVAACEAAALLEKK